MKRLSHSVEYLDFLANHFEHRDWDYTRLHHIKEIKYDKAWDERDNLKFRIKIAFRVVFKKERNPLLKMSTFGKVRLFFYCLMREKQTPDGALNDGNVITYWEETGEYLQMVQPSVGALLVDFLKEEPNNPHAKKITAELDRIMKRFYERDREGLVAGEKASE